MGWGCGVALIVFLQPIPTPLLQLLASLVRAVQGQESLRTAVSEPDPRTPTPCRSGACFGWEGSRRPCPSQWGQVPLMPREK